ncbi:class I SAM-dependent methyltransferase [Sphingomonas aquatilis]
MESHYFGADAAHMSLLRHGYFETRALIGRWVSPRRRRPKKPLLQIGSGLNPIADFENLDFYMAHRGKVRHVGHDLRRPLPYADGVFEGVYSEHTLEHMYPAEALFLLREAWRVLKPGGIFRCSVPDLKKYIDFYEGRDMGAQFGMFRSGCEALWNLTQNHMHRSVWDADMLKRQMVASGFVHAEERPFRDGSDPRLFVDLEHRAWESLYVEGVKAG